MHIIRTTECDISVDVRHQRSRTHVTNGLQTTYSHTPTPTPTHQELDATCK